MYIFIRMEVRKMCNGTLNILITNENGLIMVTTGIQFFPLRSKQKSISIKGEECFDWENEIYLLLHGLCGREIAKSINFAKLKIEEILNSNKNRTFVVKLHIPQMVVNDGPFSKTNGLVVIAEADFFTLIRERYIKFQNKPRDVNLADLHKKILLHAFPNGLNLSESTSPFNG